MTNFDVPEGLEQDSLKALEISRNTGKVRRGTNEVTKVIEREKAKLVYIAQDVQPPEIVAHLPALCDEKKIPFIYVRTKAELGRASGIDVSTAAVAVVDPGKAKKELSGIIEKVKGIRAGKAKEEPKAKPEAKAKKEEKKAEKPAEKPAEKKEEKPAEKKAKAPAKKKAAPKKSGAKEAGAKEPEPKEAAPEKPPAEKAPVEEAPGEGAPAKEGKKPPEKPSENPPEKPVEKPAEPAG